MLKRNDSEPNRWPWLVAEPSTSRPIAAPKVGRSQSVRADETRFRIEMETRAINSKRLTHAHTKEKPDRLIDPVRALLI